MAKRDKELGGESAGMSASPETELRSRLPLIAIYAAFIAAVHREIVGHSTVLHIGSYNLTSVEIVLALVVIAVARLTLRTVPRLDVLGSLALLFVLIVAASFVRGLLIDPFPAIVSLRATGVFSAFLLLGLYLRKNAPPYPRVRAAVTVAALVLVSVLVLRLLFGPRLLFEIEFRTELEINDGGRGLAAPGAVVIAVAAVMSASSLLRRLALKRALWGEVALLLTLLAALLLTRQSTATLAGLAGVTVILVFEPGRGAARRLALLSGLTALSAAILLLAPGSFWLGGTNPVLPDWLAEDFFQRAANLQTRSLIWSGLLADMSSWNLIDSLIGLPAGVRPTVFIPLWGGVYWQHSIHSMYYGTLVYGGVLGTAAYCLMLIGLVGAGLRGGSSPDSVDVGPSRALAIGLCVLIAVFGFSYELRNEQGLLFVLAMLAVRRDRSASVPTGGHLSGDRIAGEPAELGAWQSPPASALSHGASEVRTRTTSMPYTNDQWEGGAARVPDQGTNAWLPRQPLAPPNG